ncbi:MAG: DUF2956 domain-containing protein [Vibrio sp.]
MKKSISPETQQEAFGIAKATQKPGQTKEQTKLIAQGIEKGIALYKKQQKEKQREADKLRKKQAKTAQASSSQMPTEDITGSSKEKESFKNTSLLPWCLLVISWVGFIAYFALG